MEETNRQENSDDDFLIFVDEIGCPIDVVHISDNLFHDMRLFLVSRNEYLKRRNDKEWIASVTQRDILKSS